MFVFFVFTSKIYVIHKEEHLVTYFRIGLHINILNFTILNICYTLIFLSTTNHLSHVLSF